MTLQQRDIERLGRDALRVLGLPGPVHAVPSGDATGEWRVRFGDDGKLGSSFVTDDTAPAGAVFWMLESLTNDLSETDQFWGVAFPRCPGHRHPADYAVDGRDIVVRCPTSGVEVSRTVASR